MGDLFDLRGNVAIVTGGNGGIGKGIADGLALAGSDIVIFARNEKIKITRMGCRPMRRK